MARISQSQWIEYYGFQRFPFDRPEAGNEEFSKPAFLAACFVEPDCFERVLGVTDLPVTALLWAQRGIGKTACRVMVDYYCQEGKVPVGSSENYVLSVPHIHLHRPLELARASGMKGTPATVLVEHHALEILARAMPALVKLIATQSSIRDAVSSLPLKIRQDLGWLIFRYRYNLATIQAEFLRQLGIWLPTEDKIAIGYSVEEKSGERERPLPDVDALRESWLLLSPLDHLAQLAQLVRKLGIQATYVLVDGVDEFTEAAGDPKQAYQVIRPLLTNLRLMDSTPHLALKFFLPSQVEPFIMSDPAFRQDRGFIREHLRWEDETLIEILRRRLDALKVGTQEDRLVAGFNALCVPELQGRIEQDLVKAAQGNPRHLLLLCGLMVTAHCTRNIQGQEDPYQLNREDWQTALAQFEAEITPTLTPAILSSVTTNVLAVDLIKQGEHERLEFKSSLRWDVRRKQVNKQLRQTVACAIAGMLNRSGGTLLIGMADDGIVLGIEDDIKTLNKKNLDGFQLELGHIIDSYLGVEQGQHLQTRFETIDGKQICLIHIDKSPAPVYVYANSIYEFWVRMGNSTRQLDAKATHHYIQTHWMTRNE
jgi:hypothetical protein